MDAAQVQELTDDELDTFIRARLVMAGVDLSVLPEDDPEAPADQRRILASARRFLRTTPPAILGFEMDVQAVPPTLYPSGDFSRGGGDTP
jgi:hypothetical protein